MRIKHLYIPEFHILRDFEISFDSDTSVIIGENGSGKSTILEALAHIFGHLHRYFVCGDKDTDFIEGYKVEYTIETENFGACDIFIESRYELQGNNTFCPIIKVNGQELSIKEIEKNYGGGSKFLPSSIVLYYSGIANFLCDLSKYFEDGYIKKIIRENNPYTLVPLNLPKDRPFCYLKKEYVSFILAALLISEDEKIKNTISDILGIDYNSCEIRIFVGKPYWYKGKGSFYDNLSGDVANTFIGALNSYGFCSAYNIEERKGFSFYISQLRDMFDFLGCKGDIQKVFSIIETIYLNDILKGISITWDKGEENIPLERLSEGQKQFILTAGASMLWQGRNSLFLLDEPDVYLHPKWQQEFLTNLIYRNPHSHMIITTHNPIIIGNSHRDDIHIMNSGKEIDNQNYSFGRDVNSLLNDYFNVSERNSEGLQLIKNFYDAMFVKDFGKAESILEQLQKTFGESDVETVKAESMFDDLAE